MSRPLRAFLSYRRRDASEASELERQLALRGLSLWRDVNDLPLGGLTEAEIRRGVIESDAFVLYVTPRVFASDVIWRVEVPAALAHATSQARRGRRYPIVPVLRGVNVDELRRGCASRAVADLSRWNAAFVPLRHGVRATKTERRLAFAAIGHRLLRALLPTKPAGVLQMLMRSFGVPKNTTAALDLNWTGVLDGATERDWDRELLPALRDLRSELARGQRRRIMLFVSIRLAAALAMGMTFPIASGFFINVRDRQGRWSSGGGGRAPLTRRDIDARERIGAVLEVSLAQDASRGAARLARRLRARHVQLIPTGGPSRRYDPRSRAGAIGQQVGDVARNLRAEGAREIHVVFSGPAALAVVLGRHLHAVGRVHCYYRDARGQLRRSYRFRS